MERKEPKKFYSSSEARSYIRNTAFQLSEQNPELMMEFLNALDIADAALVSWLIEKKETGRLSFLEYGAESKEFELAVERLKVTLAKLK